MPDSLEDTTTLNTDTHETAGRDTISQPAKLSDLYPTPKTYEERQREDEARIALFQSRLPKHLSLVVALRLFVLVALISCAVTMAPVVIFFNIFSGAFTVALYALIVMGIVMWQTREVASILYQQGVNRRAFLGLYAVFIAPAAIVATYQANTIATLSLLILTYIALLLAHIVAVGLLMWLFTRAH